MHLTENRISQIAGNSTRHSADLKKACKAAKSHELLTARILHFVEVAQRAGMAAEDVLFDGWNTICFGIDQATDLNRGICRFYVSITPGAWREPAIRLGKLQATGGSTYCPEKSWPHPTDNAFAELFDVIRKG